MARKRWPPPSGYHLVETTRYVGRFDGFALHTVFRLEDGKTWMQWTDRTEAASLESPVCRVYTDNTLHFLEVEGLSGNVEIRACRDPEAPEPPAAHSCANFMAERSER